jgi:dTDP-4-amino-4,6-dideoxygalactose transaminase
MFPNLLGGDMVEVFERAVAEYVDAKYAVTFNSATSAIFLLFEGQDETVRVPSVIPPVVPTAILNAGCQVEFTDNTDWVGGPYLLHNWDGCKVIDSAQHMERGQYSDRCSGGDVMIFSHFPTKPVGSIDGGTIVTNDKNLADELRMMANNGMKGGQNSWDKKQVYLGYKMYMNSVQAFLAFQSLRGLDDKRKALLQLRKVYNGALGYKNTSDHLYRIKVRDNRDFVKKAHSNGITCGIHYDTCHNKVVFGASTRSLPLSEEMARTTVSIPFHDGLNPDDIVKIIKFVNDNNN